MSKKEFWEALSWVMPADRSCQNCRWRMDAASKSKLGCKEPIHVESNGSKFTCQLTKNDTGFDPDYVETWI